MHLACCICGHKIERYVREVLRNSLVASAIAILVFFIGIVEAPFIVVGVSLATTTTIFTQATKTETEGPGKGELEMVKWIKSMSPDKFQTLPYPRELWPIPSLGSMSFDDSANIGARVLYETLQSTPGQKVLYGHSQGSAVQTIVLKDYVAGRHPDMPSPDELSFYMIANPDRPNGGILARLPGLKIPILNITFLGPTPETKYNVVDVTKQYDGVSDFPEDPLNVLAVVNALLGHHYLHDDYSDVDINSPNNIVKVSGNTTYITVPTKKLPLLKPVRDILSSVGRNETPFLDAIEPGLRTIIESGYNRTTVTSTQFKPVSSLPRLLKKSTSMDAGRSVASPSPHIRSLNKRSKGIQQSVKSMKQSTMHSSTKRTPKAASRND